MELQSGFVSLARVAGRWAGAGAADKCEHEVSEEIKAASGSLKAASKRKQGTR
jgi:hypothetical protein